MNKILLCILIVNLIGSMLNMFGTFFNVLGLVIAGGILCGIALIAVLVVLIYILLTD